MESQFKVVFIFGILCLLLTDIVRSATVIKNGERENLENRALREFSSSFHINGKGNGLLSQQNSAMIHPYLQNLLAKLGPKQGGGDSDGLLAGVTSEDCKGHLLEWAARFSNETETDIGTDAGKWVLHLIDSWGKIPEGILNGHINSMGDFHECVEIKARNIELLHEGHAQPISRNFEGRYCTAYILDYGSALSVTGTGSESEAAEDDDHEIRKKLESLRTTLLSQKEVGLKDSLSFQEFLDAILKQRGIFLLIPSLGVCMPNSCSQLDIQHVLMNLLNATYAELPEEHQYPPEALPWPLVATCTDEKRADFDAAAIIVIILLSAILLLCLSAAVTDYWLDKTDRPRPTGLAFKYFMAFSLYTNTTKWLSTRTGPEDFGCIHGIRFFSTAWVVIGHTYEALMIVPAWNMFDLKNIWKNWAILSIINGSFVVDTFFAMSGALVTYSLLKLLAKTKGKLNLIMFYVHRYIRLTPTYAIIVAINATLLVYSGNGPFWIMDQQQQQCCDSWWLNLLYISNLHRADKRCVGQTWYLSNDMQFHLLAPFIVYPIWKWEKIGLALLSIYTALSCISPVLIVRYAGAPPAMVMTGDIGFSIKEIYYRPWARIQTFLVGIWLGWLLHKTRGKRINLPPLVVVGLWLLSTATACAILFGIQPWFDPDYDIPKVAGYFYAALSRFTWAIVISWIIFACVKGYGGIVNDFLSWKVFMPLGRLSYCVYLTSPQIQQIYHGRMAQPMRYDNYTIVNIFFGHVIMCHFAGFICTLLFESPFIMLQKLIFN